MMHKETWYDEVEEYLENNKIPHIILTGELIDLVNNKETQKISDIFRCDLSPSFDQGFAVYYREVITEEMLLLLHDFFRNTCCNIENIVLITTDTAGLDRYYKNYCKAQNTRGFNIIEVPWMYWEYRYVVPETYQLVDLPKKQQIKSLFSYYGGTYESSKPPERTVMTLFASQFSDIAHIDSIAPAADWAEVENYLEYLTYFCDANAISEYKNIYNKITQENKFNIPALISAADSYGNETFMREGPQWEIDSQSFFSLIRETTSTQNFYCLTEKTMRCFFHGVAPIPTHGEYIIQDLESLGFEINKNFIDYSYLKEENLFYRLKELQNQLNELKQISFDDWYSLWLENYDMFKYNCEYLINSYKKEVVYSRLDNYFK